MLVDLWRAEREPLVRYLRRKHRLTAADAEDIASETFAYLLDRGLDTPAALYRRAESLTLDLFRSATYRLGTQLTDTVLDRDTVAPSEAFEATELRADLIRALRKLPRREAQAFALTELRGLTETEAAAQLGVSRPTVNRLAASARAILREELTCA